MSGAYAPAWRYQSVVAPMPSPSVVAACEELNRYIDADDLAWVAERIVNRVAYHLAPELRVALDNALAENGRLRSQIVAAWVEEVFG